MKWEVITARNGENSLVLNGISIYSKYRPREDAWRWIENEFDDTAVNYILIGLGLGYHVEKLAELAAERSVYVYYFDETEKQLFQCNYKNVDILSSLKSVDISEKTQILIPNVWIKAIGESHPLLPFLEDIKINQLTYKKSREIMEVNFSQNIRLQDFKPYPKPQRRTACLVSSGPSLDETIDWLKEMKDTVDIYVVGSALKFVLQQNINPFAVVISDPKSTIKQQIENVGYNGELFYLSTANHETVTLHKFNRYILLQNGYPAADNIAAELNFPLLDTGGSVATIAFSLIEYLGYEKLVLFGQDFGFSDNRTHAVKSTSGRNLNISEKYRTIASNSGVPIKSSTNFISYLRWFNKKISKTNMEVFNTALFGAKIEGATYINQQQFHNLI